MSFLFNEIKKTNKKDYCRKRCSFFLLNVFELQFPVVSFVMYIYL